MTVVLKTVAAIASSLVLLASIALGAIAWRSTVRLGLPLPTSLAIVTTFLPLLTALAPIFNLSTRRSHHKRSAWPSAGLSYITLLDQLLTALPAALAAFSISYFTPPPTVTCRLEQSWQARWRAHDADSIRTVQDRLRCCGFRSTRDRAWPFPEGRGEHPSCPAVLGYDAACLPRLMEQERTAAEMVFTAAVGAFALKCILFSAVSPFARNSQLFASARAVENGENGNRTDAVPRIASVDERSRLIEPLPEENEDEGEDEGERPGQAPFADNPFRDQPGQSGFIHPQESH